MTFRTESGSVYEVDDLGTRVRRVEGLGDPTPRVGSDGEWRACESVYVKLGRPAFILWAVVEVDGQRVERATETSRVVEVVL